MGYGKTAITLGLIDASEPVNGLPPPLQSNQLLPTKATLVIVPGHLMGQWPSEVRKFLGRTKEVITISSMVQLNNLTIEAVENADLVLVSFSVLDEGAYYPRLARFCGVKPSGLPPKGVAGRRFCDVYRQCLAKLPSRVDAISSNCSVVFDSISKDAESHKSSEDNIVLDQGGKKAAYKDTGNKSGKNPKMKECKLSSVEVDPWGLRKRSVQDKYKRMKSPPLEMFFWRRVVVDE